MFAKSRAVNYMLVRNNQLENLPRMVQMLWLCTLCHSLKKFASEMWVLEWIQTNLREEWQMDNGMIWSSKLTISVMVF